MTDEDGSQDGLLGLLLQVGPWLLTISVLLVVAAFALAPAGAPQQSGPSWPVPSCIGACTPNPTPALMYAAITAGHTTWATLHLWVRRATSAR